MSVLECPTIPPMFVDFLLPCLMFLIVDILFIYCFLNNFSSNTCCIVFKGTMIVSHWNNWEGWGRKQLWHILRYSCHICGETRENDDKAQRRLELGAPSVKSDFPCI
jgi:hypothetical protein